MNDLINNQLILISKLKYFYNLIFRVREYFILQKIFRQRENYQ